jgi:uncharacterized protein YjbI with pentapeptide repeats
VSGANLKKPKLAISFSQTNLSGANLEEAELENATFALATLNDERLKGAMRKRVISTIIEAPNDERASPATWRSAD